MRILRVTKQEIDAEERNFFSSANMSLLSLSPTLLSAMTSMKIAKTVDRQEIDVVLTHTLKDTIAALSARKIAARSGFKVVQVVMPNSEVPRSIPSEILKDTDGWVMPSERMLVAYPPGLRHTLVLPPVAMTPDAHPHPEPRTADTKLVLSWIGTITDSARLNAMLDKVEETAGAFTLRICGAGKARDVMPAVRHSRALDHKDSVVWVGEEYDKAKEIDRCDAAVRTDLDLTLLETEILRSGRCVLAIDEISDFVKAPRVYTDTARWEPREYVDNLKRYIKQL